ncbi:MAG: MmgE/PrpD family protein [Flavobacteriales bacterium]
MSRPDPIGVTAELVSKAYAVEIKNIDNDTLTIAKKMIRDGIAVLLAGTKHNTVKVLVSYLKDAENRNGIKVIGQDLKCNLTDSAFIYGCAIHAMDFEPMFLPPTHAVSPVLAPLIAIAQSHNITGATFLKAFIAGIQFEASLRIGAKMNDDIAATNQNHFPFEKQGFHPPGTVGTMGSALASSIAIGLSEVECRMALGYAASRSSGISGNIGTMTKATHCGNAARSGLEAALITRHGLTSSTSILETGSGWGHVFGGSHFNYTEVINGMDQLSCFTNPGFAFKMWPAHTAMQVAINGALQLHPEDHGSGMIKITAPVFKYCDRSFPADSDEARFSFQYNVAVALMDGVITFDSYTNEKLASMQVQGYLERIQLILDSSIPPDFGTMSVGIALENGKFVSSDRWPGHWKSPMTEEELTSKFLECSATILGENRSHELMLLIDQIEVNDHFDQIKDLLFA